MIGKKQRKLWFIGMGFKQRHEAAAGKVFNMLPPDGSAVSFSELRRKAKEVGLSPVTISQHLKRLVEKGLAEREVDASTRPPTVRYRRLNSERLKIIAGSSLNIIGNVEEWLDRLAFKKDRKMVQQALEAILKIDLSEYAARLVNAFYEASTKEKGEDGLNHLKAFLEYVYVPRLLKLGLLCWVFKEEAEPATNKLLEGYLEEAKRAVGELQIAIKKGGEKSV